MTSEIICKEAHGNAFLALCNDRGQHCPFQRNEKIRLVAFSGGVYKGTFVHNIYFYIFISF